MAKMFVGVAVLLMLCVCIQPAFALGSVIIVTRETQAKLGLNYTLVADRVDAEAVLVRMEIPRNGKLKDLRSVKMRIGSGRPLVSATLQTTPGKDGVWVVSFQLTPDLADKCSIDLILPSKDALTYEVYGVELKGYVTARK
jgi:hypothetical protein